MSTMPNALCEPGQLIDGQKDLGGLVNPRSADLRHVLEPLQVTVLSPRSIMRDALGRLIDSHPRFTAQSADPTAVSADEDAVGGDLILLEMDVPLTRQLHTLRLLVQRCPRSRTVLLVGECDSPQAVACFAAGASAIVTKSEPTGALFEAMELVHSESPLLRGSMAQCVLSAIPGLFDERRRSPGLPPAVPPAITRREREVARHVADCMTTNEIAQAMTISPKTVRNHISNIYMKLGIGTREELQVRLRAAPPDADAFR